VALFGEARCSLLQLFEQTLYRHRAFRPTEQVRDLVIGFRHHP
jgi:hypothetical protein